MSRRRFWGGACVATGTRPAGRGSAGRLLLPGRGDDRAGFRRTEQAHPGRGARDTCRRRAGRGRAVRAAWAGGRLPRRPRHRGPEVHTVGAAGARLLQRLAADARGRRHGRGGGQWRGRQPAVRGPGDGRTGAGRGHRRRRTARCGLRGARHVSSQHHRGRAAGGRLVRWCRAAGEHPLHQDHELGHLPRPGDRSGHPRRREPGRERDQFVAGHERRHPGAAGGGAVRAGPQRRGRGRGRQ